MKLIRGKNHNILYSHKKPFFIYIYNSEEPIFLFSEKRIFLYYNSKHLAPFHLNTKYLHFDLDNKIIANYDGNKILYGNLNNYPISEFSTNTEVSTEDQLLTNAIEILDLTASFDTVNHPNKDCQTLNMFDAGLRVGSIACCVPKIVSGNNTENYASGYVYNRFNDSWGKLGSNARLKQTNFDQVCLDIYKSGIALTPELSRKIGTYFYNSDFESIKNILNNYTLTLPSKQ